MNYDVRIWFQFSSSSGKEELFLLKHCYQNRLLPFFAFRVIFGFNA